MPKPTPIKILLADQYFIVRAGLRCIFERARMRVVGEADNGRDAVRLAHKLKPNVVVTDISMLDLNGLEATRQILAKCHETRVLIFSAVCDPDRIDEAARSKVSGYILKSTPITQLLEAVRAIHEGNNYYSPPIRRHMDRRGAEELSRPPRPANLTQREYEVLQLLAEGHLQKQCGAILGVVARTIERHQRNLEEKIGVQGIAALTKFAVSACITQANNN